MAVLMMSHYSGSQAAVCTGQLKNKDAIVALGQKQHSTYDATHNTSVLFLLQNLQKYYPASQEADFLLWHEGDYSLSDVSTTPFSGNIRLCDFSNVPYVWGRPHVEDPIVSVHGYSPGYLKMIRFYAVSLWETLSIMGYGWVMRFDDDSRLHSPIEYNLFDNMRLEKKVYAYRMLSRECGGSVFNEFVNEYVRKELTGLPADFDFCRSTPLGYYNNFFVSDLGFWLRPEVQAFVHAFDRSNLIFSDRINDLVFQTAAVVVFTKHTERKRFVDWSYEHHTIKNGEVAWGGLETGTLDKLAKRHIHRYVERYLSNVERVVLCPASNTFMVKHAHKRRPNGHVRKFEAPACEEEELPAKYNGNPLW